jgi:hypothetical protein
LLACCLLLAATRTSRGSAITLLLAVVGRADEATVNAARTMLRRSAEEREAYGFLAMSVSRCPIIIIYTALSASLAINALSLSVSD